MIPTQSEAEALSSTQSVAIEPSYAVVGTGELTDEMFVDSGPAQVNHLLDWVITIAERLFALLVLLLTAPLMLLIGLLIRLDSPGPAIFKQQRIAKMDRRLARKHFADDQSTFEGTSDELMEVVPTFTLYKFRTYRHRGDALVPKRAAFEFDENQIDDVVLQLKDDPRITRVGRFLRRTSLDELPNFINILKGEMRLIGPRPEVREMFRYYTFDQIRKFTVKPGLTGMAQVNGRGKLNFKQTVQFDLWYVSRRTWKLDLYILLKTFKVVLLGDGSF